MKATFGGGCFWCTEAVFQRLKGVRRVVSGYSGGTVKNPTYEEVSTGTTGHAEVIQVEFAPEIISYEKLVEVFFGMHDPTQLNRQGRDVGSQYRSVIFYHDEIQKMTARKVKERFEKDKLYERPIVTQISPLKNFYPAEGYHQDYYNRNQGAPYCQAVINPKLSKLRQGYSAWLKT